MNRTGPIQRKTPLRAKALMNRNREKRQRAQRGKERRRERYLAFVRGLPCCLCSITPCDAHHVVGLGWGLSGMGLKPGDAFVMPLCRVCHMELHSNSGLLQHQPRWLVDTINRGLDQFTDEPIVGELCRALEFIAEMEG